MVRTAKAPTWFQVRTPHATRFQRFGQWLDPPVVEAPAASGALLFSGTSLATLERIIRGSHGTLAPQVTFLANPAWHCYSYARGRARKDRAPGVVLAFPYSPLVGRLKMGHYQPGAQDPKGRPVDLGAFYCATGEISLAELHPRVKDAILTYLRSGVDEAPEYAEFWMEQYELFRDAFR